MVPPMKNKARRGRRDGGKWAGKGPGQGAGAPRRKRRAAMGTNFYVYLLIAAGTLYLIRMLPLSLIRKDITNKYIRSFLYYVPFVTLAVMTFPAITEATKNPVAGYIALIVGILVAWFRKNLFETAIVCCLAVLIVEFL